MMTAMDVKLTGKLFVNEKHDAPCYRALAPATLQQLVEHGYGIDALATANPAIYGPNAQYYYCHGHFSEESWMGLYFAVFVNAAENLVAVWECNESVKCPLFWQPLERFSSLDDVVLMFLNEVIDEEDGPTVTRLPRSDEVCEGDYVTELLKD